ncbi:hypothetical protein [Helicobacter sp. 12S02634-8]|nr:hypothetical protein [Helicobacter sp. 12S02634-8]
MQSLEAAVITIIGVVTWVVSSLQLRKKSTIKQSFDKRAYQIIQAHTS